MTFPIINKVLFNDRDQIKLTLCIHHQHIRIVRIRKKKLLISIKTVLIYDLWVVMFYYALFV
jgi:hypothetical protein